jgi:Tol biopolymer transport system component
MSWSANGRWIVYTCYPESAVYTQLCMMRADGSDSRQAGYVDEGFNPSFSPGGGRIVYEQAPMHDGSTGGIYVINVDGSHRHLLIRNRDTCCAEWAPNGKHIVYQGYPGIWRVRQDGSHPRELSSIGDSPRYTPSNSILFEENGSTMVMGGGGANPHPINTAPIERDAQVAPAGGCLFGTAQGRAPLTCTREVLAVPPPVA